HVGIPAVLRYNTRRYRTVSLPEIAMPDPETVVTSAFETSVTEDAPMATPATTDARSTAVQTVRVSSRPTAPPSTPDRGADEAPLDARVARSRATVLRTATDLLVEGGPSAVTIDAIVARSGVAKSTIYRHW